MNARYVPPGRSYFFEASFYPSLPAMAEFPALVYIIAQMYSCSSFSDGSTFADASQEKIQQ